VKRSAFILAGSAAVSLGAPTGALAGTQSTNMGVSATVTANCTISTTPVAFGSVDTLAGNHDATGSVSISCTNGAPWSATANAGAGSGATLPVRRMTSGANTLAYSLYIDSSHASIWGSGSGGTSAVTGTGSGSAQSFTIYGRVPSGQSSVPAGTYTDTVSVTVTY